MAELSRIDGEREEDRDEEKQQETRQLVEEFTRVLGAGRYAQFFTRMRAEDEEKVREGMRPLVESLRLP